MKAKPVLAGLPIGELTEELGLYPALRSRQIFEWIRRGAGSFDEMSDLPLSFRKSLAEKYALFSGETALELKDPDGTVKLGLRLEDGAVIEAVMLRDGKDRKTACLSSQAGCPAACVFCKTGGLGFTRNLSSREIIGQFLHLRKKEKEISHIVIMGMGEPLLNLNEVRKALNYFTDGLGISKRRITLSTSGVLKGITDLAENGPAIRLAFSLTAGRAELRARLMPISRENPLPLVKESLLAYQQKTGQRITIEIVLLGGINSSLSDAHAAADFAEGLGAVINLIPWNPVPGLGFEGRPLRTPERRETTAFALALESRGLKVTQRTSKGLGVSGACGQLGSASNSF
jgi:23S rRNA (adenine2503-C2)-methyltransferase